MSSQNFVKCVEKTAFVIGYTGEVGKEVVKELLEKKIFKKVLLVGRRKITYDDPLYANVEQKVVDFDHLENHKDAFQNCEYGFCCLGTTRKASGAAGFVKIDHDYVVNSAKLAHETGCKRFSVVTAENANKNSYFLYPKTKGLVEQHISEIPFEKLTIVRPAMIVNSRSNKTLFSKLIFGILAPITWVSPTSVTVPVVKVAKAMIFSMCSDPVGEKIEILPNRKLHEVSDNFYDKFFNPKTS